MKDFGMEYNTIDACPNDDIIYYKEHVSKTECPKCGTSRYRYVRGKVFGDGNKYSPNNLQHKQKLVSVKIINHIYIYKY